LNKVDLVPDPVNFIMDEPACEKFFGAGFAYCPDRQIEFLSKQFYVSLKVLKK